MRPGQPLKISGTQALNLASPKVQPQQKGILEDPQIFPVLFLSIILLRISPFRDTLVL